MTDVPNDVDLVRRARRGDADAFSELVGRHERTMLAVAYACTKCSALAADVVQDAVVRCWQKLTDLREDAKFAGWLATTVRNLSVNALRSPARRLKLIGDEALDRNAVADTTASLADSDEARALREAIESLDEMNASVLILRYYEDLPSKQIADLLEMTPAAVDMRLTRARQALKAKLMNTPLGPVR